MGSLKLTLIHKTSSEKEQRAVDFQTFDKSPQINKESM